MTFLRGYEGLVDLIVSHAGGSDKFVHTYVGLAIWLAAMLALGRRHGPFLPLSIVAMAEAGNECIDRLAHGSWRWPDTLGDVAATLFWPSVLTLVLWWQRSARSRAGRRPELADPDGQSSVTP